MKYFIFILLFFISCSPNKEIYKEHSDVVPESVKHEIVKKCNQMIVPDTISYDSEIYEDEFLEVGSSRILEPVHEYEIDYNFKSEVKETVIYDTILVSEHEYQLGYVTYNVPDTMKVGNHYKIVLRVGNQYNNRVIDGISKNNTSSTTTVVKNRISKYMSAELIDTEGSFLMKGLSSEKQIIDGDYTEWLWDVVPIKSGNNNLRLIIKVFVDDYQKDIPVFEKDIYTERNVWYKTGNFISKYWQWLLSTFLIPIFIFYRKKRKKNDE